jgi:hypothetical protein
MNVFLIVAIFPLFAIFLGIKGMLSGIELQGGKRLSRQASAMIGSITIVASTAVICVAYAYIVLRLPIL